MPNVNLAPTNWQTEQEAIGRRRKMAEMLQQQSMAPPERFSTNGIEAPISWTQGLAKMLQAYQGAKGIKSAGEEEQAFSKRYQTEGQDALARGLRSLQGQTIQPDPQEAQQSADYGTPEVGSINIPPDRMAAMQAFGSHPETKGYSNAIMAQMLKGEDTKAYKPGDVLYRGDKQVGAIPNTPKEHVIGGKVYQSAPGGVTELGGPGQPIDYNKAFLPDGSPNPAYQQYELKKASRGATRVSTTIRENDKKFEKEDKLRNDYTANPKVKASAEMDSAFRMIEAAYKNPTAANDLAMATKYMKILDPTSVVRESEFALAVNATGLLDKVQNYAASVLEGKRLNPTQRKDFYDSATAINDSFQKGRAAVDAEYSDIATGYGLEPKNVIPSLRSKKVEEPSQEGKWSVVK